MDKTEIFWRAVGTGLAVLALLGLLSFLGVWGMAPPVLTQPLPLTHGGAGTSGTADLVWEPDRTSLPPHPEMGTCMQVTPWMTLEVVTSCGCAQAQP